MAANTAPIYPVAPYLASASLTAVGACTTRAPTATASLAGANIIALTATSTNGLRIDKIIVSCASTNISADAGYNVVMIWVWDGTTAYLFDEIVNASAYPSASAKGYHGSATYDSLVLPPTHRLYVSVGTATTAATNALTVSAFGGVY